MLHKRRLAGECRSHIKQAKCRALLWLCVCAVRSFGSLGSSERDSRAVQICNRPVGTVQINTAILHTQQVLSRCQLIIAAQPSQCKKQKMLIKTKPLLFFHHLHQTNKRNRFLFTQKEIFLFLKWEIKNTRFNETKIKLMLLLLIYLSYHRSIKFKILCLNCVFKGFNTVFGPQNNILLVNFSN